jgi:uncharacterized protein YkwD
MSILGVHRLERQRMSVTLRNTIRPLGGLFLLTSLSLGLGACSGGGSDDDPLDPDATERPPAAPASGAPLNGTGRDRGGDEPATGTGEGGPNVTGIDPSTAPADGSDGSAQTPSDAAAGTSTTPVGAPEVPDTDLCSAVADWDPEWVELEEEVLLLVNEFRSQPADCGAEGQFAAAAPLTMNPILRCSSRLHSLDMYERDYFEHDTPDGIDPFERMAEAGFVGSGGGENIALGQSTPEEVMAAWMDSDGHCANVMRAAFDTIGVGYHPGAGQRGIGSNYWTQNFGAPPFMRGGRR